MKTQTDNRIIPYDRTALIWHCINNAGLSEQAANKCADMCERVNDGELNLLDDAHELFKGVSVAQILLDLKIDINESATNPFL